MRAWLKKPGFKKGDLRSYIKAYPCMHPMGHACFMGELHICKWLFDNGAADDITRVSDMYDNTPLHLASHGGHLSVCQWLHKVGAAGDIPKENLFGQTPLLMALGNGHMAVHKWLLGAGGREPKTHRDWEAN